MFRNFWQDWILQRNFVHALLFWLVKPSVTRCGKISPLWKYLWQFFDFWLRTWQNFSPLCQIFMLLGKFYFGKFEHLWLDLFHFKSANKLDDWRRTIKMSILYVDTCMQSKSNSDGVILVALPWLDEYQLLPTWCYRLLVKVPNKEITKVI